MSDKSALTKRLNNQPSRLDTFQSGSQGTIGGMIVSETEDKRNEKKQKPAIVNTSIRINKELKDKAMALCALKQITFTRLVEIGIENQLKYNADLMNRFTKYHIDTDSEND